MTTSTINADSSARSFDRFLTTATAETATGVRVRALAAELAEVESDLKIARRVKEPGPQVDELTRKQRDIWDHIVEALTCGATKEEK